MTVSNDSPIEVPREDRFGLNPFATSVAAAISGMQAPEGVVLAISGPWGSGKSSAVNLIQHHLQPAIEQGQIQIIPFNPWWFAGTDALTLSFFQELSKAIGPTLGDKLKKSVAYLGQGVSAVGAFAGAIANLGSGPIGGLVASGAELIGRASAKRGTVDEEHQKVAKALKDQSRRFVVIIDDIDRLNPDDALTIFRLVKSVGRLPNVIYVLAFDRQIAERVVAERFPSEGPAYLEKIVQRFFELPPPQVDLLRNQVVQEAVRVMGEPPAPKITRYWNVFHDVVAPLIRTPRDVVRLTNHIATGWPAVAGNVDRADYLAISALELTEPDLYSRIRANPDSLCGLRERDQRRQEDIKAEYENLFGLTDRPEREQRRMRVAMRRLFPRLDAVWGNSWHHGSNWRRDRLIASRENFRSYFSFAVSEGVVAADIIDPLVQRADDDAFVEERLRQALVLLRPDGTSQAALLLEELACFAEDVTTEKVPTLVRNLFRLADDLDVLGDRSKGFASVNNQLRLYWLLNRLTHDRFSIEERGAIYSKAMATAPMEWAQNFAERCLAYYAPREDGRGPSSEPVVSEEVAEEFRQIALEKTRQAAESGALTTHSKLVTMIFGWWRLNYREPAEIAVWANAAFANDRFVIALAAQIPSEAWSFGMGMDEMGDRVSTRTLRVDLGPFTDLFDAAQLEARVIEILDQADLCAEDRATLETFRDTPRGSHRD